MKRDKLIRLIFFIFLLQVNLISKAQQAKPCGPYTIDTAALKRVIKNESKNINRQEGINAVTRVIRVYFHILQRSGGDVPAISPDNLNKEFNILQQAYAADNICFLNTGFNYINNSILDTNFTVGVNPFSLFDPYQVPNCINIFYLHKLKGSNPSCNGPCGIGGISPNLPGTSCFITTGNINLGQTIAHEVGHCLGLLHTFEPDYGYENIDGSNSSTTGDLITDTPADPYAYLGQSCYDSTVNGCVYSGNCTDPNGKKNFTPPYSNMMAYWWAASDLGLTCYVPLALTGGQYTRVNSMLDDPASVLKDCKSFPDVTLGPSLFQSSGFYMLSAINTLTTSGPIVFSGTIESTLGGTKVSLEPGFTANPTSGKISIKTLPCN